MTNPPTSSLFPDSHPEPLSSYLASAAIGEQLDPSVPPVTSATLPCNLPMLLLDPLIGQCDWRPAIAFTFLVQATQARKQQMRRRDQDILAREPGQQLIPRRCNRRRVYVEHRRDLGVLQLDALGMDGIAPKQNLLAL